MGKKVRKMMAFQFYHYKDIEIELETMAQNGLFLEKVGTMFWTFTKAEPKKVKYAVTYFSEASFFNPTATDNQQTYFEYAKEAGWRFVAQFNQMQIFCSETESPICFETDEREKFENIKKCMRKNFLPSTIVMILVFMLNLLLQYNAYVRKPIDVLSEPSRLYPIAMMIPATIYFTYHLMAYFIWCRQCEKSLSMGKGCVEKRHTYQKMLNNLLLVYTLILLALFLLDMFSNYSLVWISLIIIFPLMLRFVFQGFVYYLKKKQYSATFNRVVSFILLTVISFGIYLFLMMSVIKFEPSYKKAYRTVNWKLSPTETREYKLYQEEIPLKCEDLYGAISSEYYSYEKDVDHSIFLTRSKYKQSALPDKNSPPQIEYMLIEPKFKWVYDIVANDLKKIPQWSDQKISQMEASTFQADKAYKFYDDVLGDNGEYLLLYKDKIVWLELENPLTEEQASIIVEKLNL